MDGNRPTVPDLYTHSPSAVDEWERADDAEKNGCSSIALGVSDRSLRSPLPMVKADARPVSRGQLSVADLNDVDRDRLSRSCG